MPIRPTSYDGYKETIKHITSSLTELGKNYDVVSGNFEQSVDTETVFEGTDKECKREGDTLYLQINLTLKKRK